MYMSEEMALRLHRMMWSDMQRELGDNPNGKERAQFKFDWIHKRFPSESIANDCWLCEYAMSVAKPGDSEPYCKYCPISWPNCHCNTLGFSYAKEPISEILALPAKNKKLTGLEATYIANDKETASNWYYQYREELLSKASGIPATSAIEDHVKAIVKKAVEGKDRQLKSDCDMMSLAYCNAKKKLSEASGLEDFCTTEEHIKKIQEKAVDDYFAKMPLAKAMTTDIDNAFKQHAEEQMAPIFHALAKASGLSAGNESVKAHISEISNKAKQNGRLERSEELFKALSVYSGISKDDWRLQDHVEAIQIKERENLQPLREANGHMSSLITKYKDRLSDTSGLDRNRPVDDHVRAIFNNGFEAGKESARDLLLNKIEEILGQ